jgi:recombination protein RecA
MSERRDVLASELAESLNSKIKGQKVAFFLDGSDDTPTDINDFISTGSSLLDLAISNRPNGGIAVGRITEINGLQASGKSLLGAHILAETQKKGGIGIYIDTETSVSKDFLDAIGADTQNILYLHMETVEDIFQGIEDIVTKVRETNKDKHVTILVDSLAAASTKVEMSSDYDKDGWATSKAIIISKAMRKITQMIGRHKISLVFTNQLRQKMGVMFGDPYTTSGGLALPFHASTRIRLQNMGMIKDKDGEVIGHKCRAKIVKNRIGPPLRTSDYEMYFDRGIDDEGGWLQTLKNLKIAQTAGAWYTIDYDGTPIKFLSKDFKDKLAENEGLKDYLYEKICEASILTYEDKRGIDDVEFTDEVVDGDLA